MVRTSLCGSFISLEREEATCVHEMLRFCPAWLSLQMGADGYANQSTVTRSGPRRTAGDLRVPQAPPDEPSNLYGCVLLVEERLLLLNVLWEHPREELRASRGLSNVKCSLALE